MSTSRMWSRQDMGDERSKAQRHAIMKGIRRTKSDMALRNKRRKYKSASMRQLSSNYSCSRVTGKRRRRNGAWEAFHVYDTLTSGVFRNVLGLSFLSFVASTCKQPFLMIRMRIVVLFKSGRCSSVLLQLFIYLRNTYIVRKALLWGVRKNIALISGSYVARLKNVRTLNTWRQKKWRPGGVSVKFVSKNLFLWGSSTNC